MNKILVTLDGSPQAEQALFHALSWAEKLGPAQIVLLRVAEPMHGIAWTDLEETRAECTSYFGSLAGKLESMGLNCRFQVAVGQAMEEILKVASFEKPDLLVMSSHGRSGLGRWVLGSVAEDVMRRASCPVLLVRVRKLKSNQELSRSALPRLRSVLVPVDGSQEAERALDFCAERPFLTQKLTVMRAADLPDYRLSVVPSSGWIRQSLRAAEESLERLEERFRGRLGQATWTIQDRAPATSILELATRKRVDLIVMATHGRTGLDRILLGSVAERVMHYAPCPVLLLPPLARSPESHSRQKEALHVQ